MSASGTAKPIVLIVDDEEGVADSYAHQIRDRYEPRVAYSGEAALEKIDANVAAVLLDRRMPGLSGDEVLTEIRNRGYDCQIIMTTAVDPDLNILEMDFDDYLCKPVDKDTLLETLDQHTTGAFENDSRLSEFFRLRSKVSILEDQHSRAELETNEEYTQLKQRVAALEDELSDTVDEFDSLYELHRDIERGT